MHRRTLLAGATGTLASLAGCADAILGTPTPVDELPRVHVVASGYGALSPIRRLTLRVEKGRLEHVIKCRSGERRVATDDLSTEEYRETQRLVAGLDPASWKDRYPCTEMCATDDGMRSLSVTVDGTTYDTVVDPLRDPPAGIGRLRDHLEPYWERFDRGLNACE